MLPQSGAVVWFAKLPQTHLAHPHSKPSVRLVRAAGCGMVSGKGPWVHAAGAPLLCSGLGVGESKQTKARASAPGVGRGTDG